LEGFRRGGYCAGNGIENGFGVRAGEPG
jgi:hypothetical protein